MSESEIENYKRCLADAKTSYDCARKVFENLIHYQIQKDANEAIFHLRRVIGYLEGLLEHDI